MSDTAAIRAHEAAKAVLIRKGAPDHVFAFGKSYGMNRVQCVCGQDSEVHDADMVDFDDLPEDRQSFYRAVAAAVEAPWREVVTELRDSILPMAEARAEQYGDYTQTDRARTIIEALIEGRP